MCSDFVRATTIETIPNRDHSMLRFRNGYIVTERELLANGVVLTDGGRISYVGPGLEAPPSPDATLIDLQGGYLVPGFVDIHVHGGAGADFMDGTEDAWRTVCRAHARHGTTSLTPTTTVGRHDQLLRFLELAHKFRKGETTGARVLGAHFYGPYFAKEARGCHPGDSVRPPTPDDYEPYLKYADDIRNATVAPELPGAEAFVKACRAKGIRCNAGHSYATFEQVAAAVEWGVRHVDHLFCAMSDRARLRLAQTYPMRGGLMEATLFFDELTTEVIADGKHLQSELLRLAFKIKGPDRLALVTDANRAMDMPDGEYIFGPKESGERILKQDGVGVMPDGKSLASSVVALDECVRVFHRLVPEATLVEVIRMATLTPARIAGVDAEIGSIAVGKRADLAVLDAELRVRGVFIDGKPLAASR
jgi:N-acetylglucosamine-6-phosphate deacetylase